MSDLTNRIPLRCRLGFCRWAKWSDAMRGQIQFFRSKDWQEASIQERKCPDCNRVELRLAK